MQELEQFPLQDGADDEEDTDSPEDEDENVEDLDLSSDSEPRYESDEGGEDATLWK